MHKTVSVANIGESQEGKCLRLGEGQSKSITNYYLIMYDKEN